MSGFFYNFEFEVRTIYTAFWMDGIITFTSPKPDWRKVDFQIENGL